MEPDNRTDDTLFYCLQINVQVYADLVIRAHRLLVFYTDLWYEHLGLSSRSVGNSVYGRNVTKAVIVCVFTSAVDICEVAGINYFSRGAVNSCSHNGRGFRIAFLVIYIVPADIEQINLTVNNFCF